MAEVYYSILALWLDEKGFYPGIEDEDYFPPTVEVKIEWNSPNGKREFSNLPQNFFCEEDDQYKVHTC